MEMNLGVWCWSQEAARPSALNELIGLSLVKANAANNQALLNSVVAAEIVMGVLLAGAAGM
jgi:hypothetical protein